MLVVQFQRVILLSTRSANLHTLMTHGKCFSFIEIVVSDS